MITQAEALELSNSSFPNGPEAVAERIGATVAHDCLTGCEGWCWQYEDRVVIYINSMQPGIQKDSHLPLLGQEFTVPYAYKNGVLNLVKPHEFERNSAKSALDLAIRGDLIEKPGVDDHQKSRLVVISKFAPKCDPDFVRHVDQLFTEYSVKHVPATNVEEFASQVEAEAHGGQQKVPA